VDGPFPTSHYYLPLEPSAGGGERREGDVREGQATHSLVSSGFSFIALPGDERSEWEGIRK